MVLNDYYVPSYLTSVSRQYDGYPVGVPEDQKIELERLIREMLTKHKHLSLVQIEYLVRDKVPCLKDAKLWDYIYATIDRALRSVAQPVYELSDTEQSKLKYETRHKKLALLPLKYTDVRDSDHERQFKGKKQWYLLSSFCSTFPELFKGCHDNYGVLRVLRDAGVIRHNNQVEVETCCLYLYFNSEKSAKAFVDRFNNWAMEQLPERKEQFAHLLQEK